jgi:hypothetical protein
MMRQAGTSSRALMSGLSYSHGSSSNYEPTFRDRVKRLQDSSKKGICKITKKKDILGRVLRCKKELLAIANGSNSDCHSQLNLIFEESIKSNHQINKYNNNDLSSVIASLFDLFSVLNDHLIQNQRRTRQSATKPSLTQQIISDIMELCQELDDQIIDMVQQLGENDPMLKGISLTPLQKSLLFDTNRIPHDKAIQLCVFCNHYSTNTCIENQGMGGRNNAKNTRLNEKMVVWDEYQKAVELAKSRNKDPPPYRMIRRVYLIHQKR